MPPNNAATRAAVERSLADLSLRTDAWVHSLRLDAEPEDHDLLLRLVEIGFLPGQRRGPCHGRWRPARGARWAQHLCPAPA